MRTDEKYWKDYDGLQAAKHQLLGRYLDGWFPILSSFRGRVLYVDCHAGRGMHETGDPGSPIVALQHLLNHSRRDAILSRVDVIFQFFEINEENAERLEEQIRKLGTLPRGVVANVYPYDYEGVLSGVLDYLDNKQSGMAPAFAFLDPYGFDLSNELMNRFLNAGPTELLINFMYKYINMAAHTTGKEDTLDELFGNPDWRRLPKIADKNWRYQEAVKLFTGSLQARYVSRLEMRDTRGEMKYVLFHATNHVRGRQVFKDAMWAVTPDGSFTAFERDRPEQGVLFGKNVPPPLGKVRELLHGTFAGQTVRLNEDIHPLIDASPYKHTHAHKVLREDVRSGQIENPDEPGKFVVRQNPRLLFKAEE